MRKLLVLLLLVLTACGGNGSGFGTSPEPAEVVLHAPQLPGLELSPGYATVMDGGGSIDVTAQIAFSDTGLDIATIHVEV